MINKFRNFLKEDYNRKTLIFTLISSIVLLLYAIYNGILGILYKTIWNQTICFYYLLLLFTKSLLLIECRKKDNTIEKNYLIIIISFVLLFITTISMIAPSILMIKNKRSFDLGIIPAITLATYTTYSITMAIINLSKVHNNSNQFIKQIRLINIISALMSITVLQNTLITVSDGYNKDMKILSCCSTFAIICSIIILIIVYLIGFIKKKNISNNKTI